MRMKEKQATVETIEQQLSTARAELADAQSKLGEAISREKELSDKRAPLLRAAKIGGDQKAQDTLDRLTAQRSSAVQEVDDFGATIDTIQQDILDLEHQHAQAQRQRKIEQLRTLKAQRGRVAEQIESLVKSLNGELIGYGKLADELMACAYDLGLGNTTTRGMLGVPLVRDYVQRSLRTLFPNLTYEGQSFSLSEAESQATAALESELRSAEREG